MSANADTTRRLYRALAAQDVPQTLQLLSPGVEVRQSPQLPWGGVFMATRATWISWAGWCATWTPASAPSACWTPERRWRSSAGRSFDVALLHLYDLEGGLITRGQICIDTAELLRVLDAAEGPGAPPAG